MPEPLPLPLRRGLYAVTPEFAAAADLLAAAIERAAEPSALQEQSRKA